MRSRFPAFLGTLTLGLAVWVPGNAAQTVGGVVAIRQEASGQIEGRTYVLAAGDDVYRNETIRTGAASSAEVGFLDKTRLAIGASALVKLDRFVYDPERGAKSVVLTAESGVARFVTGSGPWQAYRVQTPHATIAVRGTVFDVLVQRNQTVVLNIEGAEQVCLRSGQRLCQELASPGDVAIATAGSLLGPQSAAAQSLDVDRLRSALGGDTIALLASPPQQRGWWFGKGVPR